MLVYTLPWKLTYMVISSNSNKESRLVLSTKCGVDRFHVPQLDTTACVTCVEQYVMGHRKTREPLFIIFYDL